VDQCLWYVTPCGFVCRKQRFDRPFCRQSPLSLTLKEDGSSETQCPTLPTDSILTPLITSNWLRKYKVLKYKWWPDHDSLRPKHEAYYVWVKVNAVPLHANEAQSGDRYICVPILDPDSRRGWMVSATPRSLYRWETDPLPVVQEAAWMRVRSGAVRITSALPVFEPRIVQLVARRYADWAIPAAVHCVSVSITAWYSEFNIRKRLRWNGNVIAILNV
jgi:hypothetical protein